jgi:uncharacterized protein with PhoU and TrkA domain
VVQIDRGGGEPILHPPADLSIAPGDGLLVVGRGGGRINAVFTARA